MSVSMVLFVSFAILLLLNLPIAVALGLSSLLAILVKGVSLSVLPMLVYSGIAKFTLLAIPFFIMAGVIMEQSGISARLIRLADTLCGHFPGGLAVVAVITSMFFAAISGSGPATVAALGTIIIPAMIKAGYPAGMASALMATSGGIGIIIPPSIPFVLYAVIAEVSIARMFIAGIVPGIIVGLVLIIMSIFLSVRYQCQSARRMSSATEIWKAFLDAFWGLLTPIIILGGIYGGFFTPTEAAAVAVVYGLFVGIFIYKEISWKKFFNILIESSVSTAVVMLVVASATLFAWVVTTEGITTTFSKAFLSISSNPVVVMVIMNIILLIAGCFLDAVSAIYIFTPILLPVALQIGIDPVVFGVIMTTNLAIGLVTPPVGVNLYVACGISKISIKDISRSLIPFFIASLIALLLITYVPAISLWLPTMLGVK